MCTPGDTAGTGSWGTPIMRTTLPHGRWSPGGPGAERSCLWRPGDTTRWRGGAGGGVNPNPISSHPLSDVGSG